MSFISDYYLFFLIAVAAGYYLLPIKFKTIWLLCAGYLFYLTWQPAFLIILICVTLISFFSAQKIASAADQTERKRWLFVSVILLLSPLIFFKYYNFLDENLVSFFYVFGFGYSALPQKYLVPLGISFFTFQSISYVADVYRNYLPPEKRIVNYAVYISFFPTLLAGPIERAKSILTQINSPADFDYQNIRAGLQLILWGVFKKVVLADRMVYFLEKIYNDPQHQPGILIYFAAIFTGLQVFCDFSAYSDIAVGSARILGIGLSKNFDDRVYAAPSREIFWKGWHRSLTSWMRDYVFFPLSKRAKSKAKLYLNLVIVYFLVGLWHGATWGFIVWGLLNGVWLVAESVTKNRRHAFFTKLGLDINGKIFYFFSWLFIFHVGAFFGIFFRTKTPLDAYEFIKNIANPNANLRINPEIKNCLIIIVFLIFMDFINRKIPPDQNFDAFIGKEKIWIRWGIYILLAELILQYLYLFDNARFVYFNF